MILILQYVKDVCRRGFDDIVPCLSTIVNCLKKFTQNNRKYTKIYILASKLLTYRRIKTSFDLSQKINFLGNISWQEISEGK